MTQQNSNIVMQDDKGSFSIPIKSAPKEYHLLDKIHFFVELGIKRIQGQVKVQVLKIVLTRKKCPPVNDFIA